MTAPNSSGMAGYEPERNPSSGGYPTARIPRWKRLRRFVWPEPPLYDGPPCTGDFLTCGCPDCDEYYREGGKCHGG